MSEMIASNLGIGVLPLGACFRKLEPLGLEAVRLTDAWAERRLLIATSAARALSGSVAVLVEHLSKKPESEPSNDGKSPAL